MPLRKDGLKKAKKEFWSRVNKGRPNQCWDWIGTILNTGYGYFAYGRSRYKLTSSAHRFSMMVHLDRKLKTVEQVLHKCDNRKCVNPKHLFLGNHQANMDDMVNKGRSCWGERINTCKLNRRKVLRLIGLYHTGKYTERQLAKIFGVGRTTIWMIINEKSWKRIRQDTQTTR